MFMFYMFICLLTILMFIYNINDIVKTTHTKGQTTLGWFVTKQSLNSLYSPRVVKPTHYQSIMYLWLLRGKH